LYAKSAWYAVVAHHLKSLVNNEELKNMINIKLFLSTAEVLACQFGLIG